MVQTYIKKNRNTSLNIVDEGNSQESLDNPYKKSLSIGVKTGGATKFIGSGGYSHLIGLDFIYNFGSLPPFSSTNETSQASGGFSIN